VFNVVENKSGGWGTSPFHLYFTTLLPRIAPLAYPLGMLGVLFVKETRRYMIPVLLFIMVYSALPHKEWRYLAVFISRFVVYVIPILNLSAAAFISKINSYTGSNSIKRVLQRLFMLSVYIGCIVSFSAACFGTYVSRLNYPGGEAIERVNILGAGSVHIDAYNAGNGVNLFYHTGDGVTYSKDEGVDEEDELKFDFLIREWREDWDRERWEMERVVEGYDGVRIKKVEEILRDYKAVVNGDFDPLFLMPVEVKLAPKSMILKRRK
jgi:alpha-1,6-mannosyltransferase